ncbi:MAG: nucleoside diphosphate kinase regulator [Phycisphaerae bacterium]|nr:nucleoside diphosphate kinase regulator [Phycisphaerae bacterium]
MARQRAIYITKSDYERLTNLISQYQSRQMEAPKHLEELEAELKRAHIVSPMKIAPDVITMNSTIRLKDIDTEEVFDYRLVYPQDADPEKGWISVLAPIGTALLGFSAGDDIQWEVPAGQRHLHVQEVLYQPEAAGDYTL